MKTTAPYPVSTFSPGPYTCELDRDGCDDVFTIVAANGSTVAQIVFWDSDDGWTAQAEANAALLTTAPDLYDAACAPDLDSCHDLLSDILEDPEAGNDALRDAAIDLCDALARHHDVRRKALGKANRR